MFKSIYPEEKLSFVLKEILVCYLGILVLHFFLFWQKKKKKKKKNSYTTCWLLYSKQIYLNNIFRNLGNKASKMNGYARTCYMCYCHSSAVFIIFYLKILTLWKDLHNFLQDMGMRKLNSIRFIIHFIK